MLLASHADLEIFFVLWLIGILVIYMKYHTFSIPEMIEIYRTSEIPETLRKTLASLVVAGCTDLGMDAAPKLIHARFDPDARVIPMPTDVLRDATAGHLTLADARSPNDSPAATEFYDYLETMDGWSTLMSATVEFTGAIDPKSLDGNLEIWHWGAVPERVSDVRLSVSSDGKKLQIDPPRTGWIRGVGG